MILALALSTLHSLLGDSSIHIARMVLLDSRNVNFDLHLSKAIIDVSVLGILVHNN